MKEITFELNNETYAILINDRSINNFQIHIEGKSYEVEVSRSNKGYVVKIDKARHPVTVKARSKHEYEIDLKKKLHLLKVEKVSDKGIFSEKSNEVSKKIKAPIEGTVSKVKVAQKDKVRKNQCLIILSAMKMENEICSPTLASIKKVYVRQGDHVKRNQLLIELE